MTQKTKHVSNFNKYTFDINIKINVTHVYPCAHNSIRKSKTNKCPPRPLAKNAPYSDRPHITYHPLAKNASYSDRPPITYHPLTKNASPARPRLQAVISSNRTLVDLCSFINTSVEARPNAHPDPDPQDHPEDAQEGNVMA